MVGIQKSIFEYDNYRVFLREYYLAAKIRDKKFSYRFFSRLLGYSSPIFIKRVIDGTRNLTVDGIQRFTKALKLNKEEGLFFRDLVLLNQSKDDGEKKIYAKSLLRSRSFAKLFPLKQIQFRYYAQWFLVPIRELVGLPGFKEDPEWISRMLTPGITPSQAKKGLEELEALGLIQRQEGKLRQTSADVTTPDEIISSFKADWLRELIRLGSESIKNISRERRDISSVTVGASKEALEEIKELAKKFRRDVMEVATQKRDLGKDVYQLNIQFFPLTQGISEEKK